MLLSAPFSFSKTVTAMLGALALSACSAATHDKVNKTLNPLADQTRTSRDAGIERLAEAVCNTYGAHHAFGRSEKYGTAEECVTDYKSTFQSKYDAATCGEPHTFNAAKLARCEQRAKNWESSSNVFDLAGFMTSCAANSICQ